jgi:hypothetical protein
MKVHWYSKSKLLEVDAIQEYVLSQPSSICLQTYYIQQEEFQPNLILGQHEWRAQIHYPMSLPLQKYSLFFRAYRLYTIDKKTVAALRPVRVSCCMHPVI